MCTPIFQDFSDFSISNFYDGALAPVNTRHCDVVYAQTWQVLTPKTVSSHSHVLVQPMLLHRMALVSFRLFCKKLSNLQQFFWQMVYRPPPP